MVSDVTISVLELAQGLAADFKTRADEADKLGQMPAEDVRALRESGYLTLTVPREYGGFGLAMRDVIEAQLELAQGSTSSALLAAMPLHMFGHASEVDLWSRAIFERFCDAAVNGAVFNSVASEPVLGSPSRGAIFSTTATPNPDGDGWLVNGHKNWATGGEHLTHMLVSLSLEGEPVVMLIENDRPGIRWEATWKDALSLRASDSHDVYFEDVAAPTENLVERQDSKMRTVPNAWFPMLAAATYLGAAVAARDDIIKYVLERVPTALGKPIATLPKIQRQIGEIDVLLQAARALLFETAGDWTGTAESREAMTARITATKHFALEAGIEAAEKALRIAGGAGLSGDLPFERYFRDARPGLAHPPMGDTALETIGRGAIEALDSKDG